jgi:hypothetical protein
MVVLYWLPYSYIFGIIFRNIGLQHVDIPPVGVPVFTGGLVIQQNTMRKVP